MGFENPPDSFALPQSCPSRTNEARRKYIASMDEKFKSMRDWELEPRRYVLYKNCMRRLKEEVLKEEIFEKDMMSCEYAPENMFGMNNGNDQRDYRYTSPENLSPSCLSPLRCNRSGYDTVNVEDHNASPAKRPRLDFHHEDKENGMDIDLEPRRVLQRFSVDPQDILQEIVETCSNTFNYRNYITPTVPSNCTNPFLSYPTEESHQHPVGSSFPGHTTSLSCWNKTMNS